MSVRMTNCFRGPSACARRLIATAIFAGLAAGPALAQNTAATSTSAANDQLSEIVVTAQFRKENLQTTPIAITAITSQMIEDRSMTNVQDVAADVPSATLLKGSTAFGPSMVAFIRGIGQYDQDPAYEPGVGVYVDDVYYATITGSGLDLLDLARVEVLRGPQGTLSGMNSIGGSIKLYSIKPDANAGTSLDVLYGSRNHIEARGNSDFVVVPDELFVRMAAVYNHQDGYVNVFDFACSHPSFTATPVNPMTGVPNGPPGTYSMPPNFLTHAGSCLKNQEGGTDYQGLRLSARWLPSNALEVNLEGDITQQDQENPATTLLYANKPTITLPATNTATGATAYLPYSSTLVPSILASNRYTSYAGFNMPAFAGIPGGVIPGIPALQPQPAYSAPDTSQLLIWGTALNVDWKINDILSLKSISGFRGYSSTWYEDNDDSEWPLGLGGEYLQHHQFTQELRLNGSVGKLLDFTVGGFYFNEITTYGTHQDLWYAIFPGALDFLGDDPVTAKDKAGFLQTVWHLTDKLNLIGGVRYTSQSKDYTFVRVNPEGGTGGSAFAVGSLNGVTGSYSANKTDYRVDIDYQWTDDIMTYAEVSTGFKGGGVNPRPFYAFQVQPFQPETVTTYEVGIKSQWFNNTLRANLDGYYSHYKDIQLTLLNCDFLNPPGFPPNQPCALPFNAGDADIKGVELEAEEHLGGLEIDASGDYLDFKYTSIVNPPPTGVTLGMTTPYTPEWQGHAGIQYSIPLGSWGSVTPRLDADMRTEVWTNAVNSPTNHIGGYTLYNARITWKPDQGNWEASLLALNLTDHFYYVNKFDLTGAGAGSVTGEPGPPLEVAIEIKHKF